MRDVRRPSAVRIEHGVLTVRDGRCGRRRRRLRPADVQRLQREGRQLRTAERRLRRHAVVRHMQRAGLLRGRWSRPHTRSMYRRRRKSARQCRDGSSTSRRRSRRTEDRRGPDSPRTSSECKCRRPSGFRRTCSGHPHRRSPARCTCRTTGRLRTRRRPARIRRRGRRTSGERSRLAFRPLRIESSSRDRPPARAAVRSSGRSIHRRPPMRTRQIRIRTSERPPTQIAP